MIQITQIKLSKIKVDKENPRENISEEEAINMGESIIENGQKIPIDVEELKDGEEYLIDDGHRRIAGITVNAKKTKTDPLVDCIVHKTLSKEDRLLKRCVIDAQQKNWGIQDRDKAWKELYKYKKHLSDSELAKTLGINNSIFSEFKDRVTLDQDLIKGIPIASISETKNLKGVDRTALLKKIKDKGITRKEIRATSSILKNSSSVLKKAVLNDDIDFKKAEKIKSLSEEKQKIIIANIKSTREQENEVISRVKGTKDVKVKEQAKKMIAASQIVEEVQDEILAASQTMSKVAELFRVINEKDLHKHFSIPQKQSLKNCYTELNEELVPALKQIEKALKVWGI